MFKNILTMWTFILIFSTVMLIQVHANNKKINNPVLYQVATPVPIQQIEPTQTPVQARPVPTATTEELKEYEAYRQVIEKTSGMVCNQTIQQLVRKYGLNILNVTWEDTGRFKGSCVGPNISDMTIQVNHVYPGTDQYSPTYMPVIRYDNFSDKTADISPDKFYLLVGNENGHSMKAITLKEFLKDITKYLHNPRGWKNQNSSLLAQRDTHVLVSAQACFLPVPKHGKAKFNPFLYNYQSYAQDPAVLTILATREGTSVSVGGQCLFFNQNGQKASLTGERISDFRENLQQSQGNDNNTVEANGKTGLNMVLLIQVPLKQKNPPRYNTSCMEDEGKNCCASSEKLNKSDVESAVIGHGELEAPIRKYRALI
jgi:hypothetical protein